MVASINNKVLITGYRGFTGLHLASAMRDRGYEVYGVVRDKSRSIWEYQADITNIDKLTDVIRTIRPDYIIHLAAVSFVGHQETMDFYNTNLFGTLNLLEAIQKSEIIPKKILISSSANIYGNPKQFPIVEDCVPSPINHYANSKLAMEYMVRLWFDRLPIIIVRPFNYTGPSQESYFLIPKIVSHFRRKELSIKLGNLDVIRDISDINQVTEYYIKLLEHSVCSEIVNICSGVSYSIDDVLQLMTVIAGYKIKVEVDASLVRADEIKKLIGSTNKLQQLVGKVDAVPLVDTLTRMFHS